MNLDHLIFIVQENRSFDHYFGTFPGADGIPRKPDGTFAPCVPDPNGPCRRPYHDRNTVDGGGPHGSEAATTDINGGRMDGFLRALEIKGNVCSRHPHQAPCPQATPGPGGTPDAMGFHTEQEIPNYWAYARRYVLHDRDVRAGRFLDPALAPVPGVGLGGDVPEPQRRHELHVRGRYARVRTPPIRGTPGHRPMVRRGPTSGATSPG